MASLGLYNLWKRFGKITAVKGLTLEVKDKEFMVLLGPSGAGKTTTLKLIAGVEKPNDGYIMIGDKVVNATEPHRRNIAMAFETYALYPHFTVYENLAFPLRAPGMRLSAEEIDRRVRRVAEVLNIDMLFDRKPAELSNGQKQRVSLGRTMVREPNVFLLDEPLSHLDAKLRHHMRMEFKRLESSLNTTVVYVTHDYLEALALADRIAVINQGELQQVGTPDEIFNRPANQFVATALGQPEINLIDGDIITESGVPVFVAVDGEFRLEVPRALRAPLGKKGLKKARVGVRPFDIRVAGARGWGVNETETGAGAMRDSEEDRAGKAFVRGRVYVFESLGNKGVLTVQVGKARLSVLTSADFKANVDENITLEVDCNKIMMFDPETTGNIALTMTA
ncbi:MAG TPA: ABC transporter ATP-binding protein [Firmicutes bacterium]|nr:ABC transporter ATP-binding protein [Bacillota bacterium]